MAADLVSAGVNAASNMGQANASADEAARKRKLQVQAFNEQKRLNDQSYNTGQEQMQQGEQQLIAQNTGETPMINEARNAITRGGTAAQTQAAGQTNLALAQQGVRGGQAAITSGEQAGKLSQGLMDQLNQLAYQDATRKGQNLSNYYGTKAGTGQQATTRAYNSGSIQ
jgi:hypothetical protein